MLTLVTGGAGFIGTNLASRLIGEGRTVVVVDDFSGGREICSLGETERLVALVPCPTATATGDDVLPLKLASPP